MTVAHVLGLSLLSEATTSSSGTTWQTDLRNSVRPDCSAPCCLVATDDGPGQHRQPPFGPATVRSATNRLQIRHSPAMVARHRLAASRDQNRSDARGDDEREEQARQEQTTLAEFFTYGGCWRF